MFAQTIFLPPKQFASAIEWQTARVRDAATSFAETLDAEGLGRALPLLLRDIVTISFRYDLERLPPADGQRLAELIERHRAALHRDFGGSISAARIDAGMTAAVASAGMIGRPWAELEAIPDALLRGRGASVTVLANEIESATLAEIAAQVEPDHPDAAPPGALLN
ncbi:hypothetical protein [Aureimonas leprariae]|uniref:Uncharacterized protein n=1 Tax=Plantimonas leprariae TaxID=2615207 RepID=A0A7V7PMB8_9HYPH|nr:hypothetical protein [Aureimonas leprariae]KAB0678053.1 hypothetical protein F6X38_16640 [Aureimonas leprariae]